MMSRLLSHLRMADAANGGALARRRARGMPDQEPGKPRILDVAQARQCVREASAALDTPFPTSSRIVPGPLTKDSASCICTCFIRAFRLFVRGHVRNRDADKRRGADRMLGGFRKRATRMAGRPPVPTSKTMFFPPPTTFCNLSFTWPALPSAPGFGIAGDFADRSPGAARHVVGCAFLTILAP